MSRIRLRTRRLALAILLAAGSASGPVGAAPWAVEAERHDRSPLPVNDVFLLAAPILRLEPRGVEVAPAGSWSWTAMLSAANSYSRSEAVEAALERRGSREPLGLDELRGFPSLDGEPTRFLVDGEVERLAIGAQRGLGRGWQVGVIVPLFTTGGGRFDRVTEDYHEAAGFPQQGRDCLPRDAFLLYLSGPSGELFVNEEPGSAVGEPTLSAVRKLGGRPLGIELALRGAVKLPTSSGRSLHGTGSLDAGLEGHARHCGDVWCAHGSLGLYRLGEWEGIALEDRTVPAAALGGQLLLPAGNSLLAQTLCSGEPLGPLAIAELSGDACEFSGGWRWSSREASWTLAFTENLFVSDTGSDFALHLLWRHGR